MAPLMKFDAGVALAGFTDLAFKLTSGTNPLGVLWPRLAGLKFRDADGRYWAPGVCSKRWFRFDEGRWQRLAPAAGALEAPVDVAAWLSVPEARESGTSHGTPDSGDREKYTDGVASMDAIVAGVMADYGAGLYSSADAEALLRKYYAPDARGTIWTLGCRTRRWYGWRENGWRAMPAPPAKELRPSPGDRLQAVDEQIQCALLLIFASDTPLPEPVALPWQPPAGVPETPRFCTLCLAANPVDSAFCRLCGATAERLVSDPEIVLRRSCSVPDAGRGCPDCGEPCAAGARFCMHCGANLDAKPAKRTCAACGQELAEKVRFCTRCGLRSGS